MRSKLDLLLSHSRRDQAVVEGWVARLGELGITAAGRAWEPGSFDGFEAMLDNDLDAARGLAIVFGADGLGPWDAKATRWALQEAAWKLPSLFGIVRHEACAGVVRPFDVEILRWLSLHDEPRDGELQSLADALAEELEHEGPGEDVLASGGVFDLPLPSLGEAFRGRAELLAALSDGFEDARAVVLARGEGVGALGGAGASRLAIEHAWRSRAFYDHVFFVPAASSLSLELGLARLAGPGLLGLGNESSPPRPRADAVLRWLREHERWLLILDGVSSTDTQREVLALLELPGHLILVSDMPLWPASCTRLAVGPLAAEQAVDWLFAATEEVCERGLGDLAHAEEIARRAGCLPLLLEIVVAHLVAREISFETYLRSLGGAASESELERAEEILRHSIATLSPAARCLLRLMGHFAAAPVRGELLRSDPSFLDRAIELLVGEGGPLAGQARRLGHRFAPGLRASISATLEELEEFALAFESEGGLVTHARVREAARRDIPLEAHRDWCIHAAQLLLQRLHWTDDSWPMLVAAEDTPHALHLLALAREHEPSDELANLLGCLAGQLRILGLPEQGEPLAREALAALERGSGRKDFRFARGLRVLGHLLDDLDRLADAEPLLTEALAIDEADHDPADPRLVPGLVLLGSYRYRLGLLEQAEPLLRRAASLCESAPGGYPQWHADSLHILVRVLTATERLEDALELQRRAVVQAAEELGLESRGHGIAQLHLGNLLAHVGASDEAHEAIQEGVAILAEEEGERSPDVGYGLLSLGRLALERGELESAADNLEQALELLTAAGTDEDELSSIREDLEAARAGQPKPRGPAVLMPFVPREATE